MDSHDRAFETNLVRSSACSLSLSFLLAYCLDAARSMLARQSLSVSSA